MINKRKAVTLRFKDSDLKIINQIVRKEFGPGVSLEVGMKAILINITQAYLNNLAEINRIKEEESNKDGQPAANDSSGDNPSIQVQDDNSSVLADSGDNSVSE